MTEKQHIFPRHANTTFCDSVRLEYGRKLSLIGAYPGIMYVEDFPHTIRDLECVISVRSETPFEYLKTRFYLDDEEIDDTDELILPQQECGPAVQESMPEKSSATAIHAHIFMKSFSDLEVTEACVLRVEVETEREFLKAPGLVICSISNEDDQDDEGGELEE